MRTHDRMSWALISALIGLALAFDLLSIYAKEIMGAPLLQGGVISVGVVVALFIIVITLIAAFYYVRCMNRTGSRQSGGTADG